MSTVDHFSELQLLALLDEELPRPEAATARSHLTRCFPCHRFYEGLRRESDVLRAAAAPETSSRREVAHELGWVVAAGLVLSLGLVAFRRVFLEVGEIAAETPMPDAVPLVSDLGFRLLSLLDFQQLGLQIAYGGIILMTLAGISLASAAIRRSRAGVMPLLLAALLPAFGALSTPAEALEVVTGDGAGCRVAAEKVVNDDLLLLCEEATIQGTVRGDLYFAGRSLVITGRVDGDVFGFGNAINQRAGSRPDRRKRRTQQLRRSRPDSTDRRIGQLHRTVGTRPRTCRRGSVAVHPSRGFGARHGR